MTLHVGNFGGGPGKDNQFPDATSLTRPASFFISLAKFLGLDPSILGFVRNSPISRLFMLVLHTPSFAVVGCMVELPP
jgi:hypothetical protein